MEWKEQAPNPSPHATFLRVIAMLNKLRLKDFKGDEGKAVGFYPPKHNRTSKEGRERMQIFFVARRTIDTKHAVARQGFAAGVLRRRD